GLLIYKKILLIDYHSGNPSTGKSIEPFFFAFFYTNSVYLTDLALKRGAVANDFRVGDSSY
ncbi:hypothetical protein, partial [Levilactobacillus lindianensis]|uniref:hypothetical protein n=1 Tax=Levilactobacillus lindianensis TaxID=2486018 RepID=UPI001CDCA101